MYPIRGGKDLIPIGTIIDRSAAEMPKQLALKKDETAFSYKELSDFSAEVAAGLLSKGLRPGDRIGIIGENCPLWCVLYLSIVKGGFTVVPIDPMLPIADIQHIISDSKIKVVFCDKNWCDDLRELKIARVVPFKDAEKLRKTNMSLPEIDDMNSLAAIIYTSGTTGFSKGVKLSHRNIAANVDSLYKSIDYDERDRFLALLPLHHTFMATCGFLTAIYNKAQIFFPKSLKSRDIIEALNDYKITVMLVVPLILEKFVQGIERKVRKEAVHHRLMFGVFSSVSQLWSGSRGFLFKGIRTKLGMRWIRYIISGGAALPEEIAEKIECLGIPLIQGYGLSEAAPVLTVNPPDKPKNKSVGQAIPGVKVKIKNPDENGVGEIIAKGDNVMLGYYQNEEATKEIIVDEWLHTGDLGYLDLEDYLYIVGRKKNVIVTASGKNIFPEEVEEKLIMSEYISEILVLPDRSEGREEVVAMVFPDFENLERDLDDLNPEKVEKIIKKEIINYGSKLPEYKRVKRFTIREEEFPKTTTKKIKRHLFVGKKVEV